MTTLATPRFGSWPGVPRPELAKLHGMGPKALGILEAVLAEHGLSLG